MLVAFIITTKIKLCLRTHPKLAGAVRAAMSHPPLYVEFFRALRQRQTCFMFVPSNKSVVMNRYMLATPAFVSHASRNQAAGRTHTTQDTRHI